jgi:hypothetical protein
VCSVAIFVSSKAFVKLYPEKKNTKLHIVCFPFTFDVPTHSSPVLEEIERVQDGCNKVIPTNITAHKKTTSKSVTLSRLQ